MPQGAMMKRWSNALMGEEVRAGHTTLARRWGARFWHRWGSCNQQRLGSWAKRVLRRALARKNETGGSPGTQRAPVVKSSNTVRPSRLCIAACSD